MSWAWQYRGFKHDKKTPSLSSCLPSPDRLICAQEAAKMSKGAWVYILQCSDDSYYTGSTTFLDQRMEQHHLGICPGYTSARRPVKLVWLAEFPDIFQAMEVEKQIKGWSRKKKEALIKGDFDLLHELAQSTEMKKRRDLRRKKRGSSS